MHVGQHGDNRVRGGAHHGLQLGLNALIGFFLQLDEGHKVTFVLLSLVNSPSILRLSRKDKRELRTGTMKMQRQSFKWAADCNPDNSI